MSRIECFRTALDFVPEEYAEVRECLEKEIEAIKKKTSVNPQTKAIAEQIVEFMNNVEITTKKELQEVCETSHQRVAAAANYLENHGFLTVHSKDDNHPGVWYSRN